MRKKKVCTVAPIPGETKVWQYITLMKRIYLIDCPGIVPPSITDTPTDILLRGVVRVENVDNPEQYIPAVLAKVKPHHMERTYELKGWTDHIHFLELLARKGGRLLKAGEPDVDGIAKMVLNDFSRGKIPWFTPAPAEEAGDATALEGREGRLGEMRKKRKREDGETVAAVDSAGTAENNDVDDDDDDESDDGEFEGFEDEPSGEFAQAKKGTESDDDDMIPLDELSDDDDSSDEEAG